MKKLAVNVAVENSITQAIVIYEGLHMPNMHAPH